MQARSYFNEHCTLLCETNLPPLLPSDTQSSVRRNVIKIAKKKVVRVGEQWIMSQVNKGEMGKETRPFFLT